MSTENIRFENQEEIVGFKITNHEERERVLLVMSELKDTLTNSIEDEVVYTQFVQDIRKVLNLLVSEYGV